MPDLARALALSLLLAAAVPAAVLAQAPNMLEEASYWAWREGHSARVQRAVAGSDRSGVATAASADQPAPTDGGALAPLLQEAAAVRTSQPLAFAHGEYLLALEYLRLAADVVRASRERGGDSARATATLRDRLAVVATLAHATDPAPAPPIRPAWPALAVPTAPSRGLAVVARDGVELAVLEVRRPYVPAEGPPADPSLEYLVVRFRLTNEGASDVPYFTLSDFALLLPDGREVPPLALGEADRYETGTLAPGDTLIANVAYLVRHGAMPLVLRFSPAGGPAMETALP